MNNLVLRAISGSVFVLTVIACLYIDHYLFAFLFLFFGIVGQAEFFKFSNYSFDSAENLIGMLSGFIAYVSGILLIYNRFEYPEISWGFAAAFVIPYLLLMIFGTTYRTQKFSHIISSIFYIVIPFLMLYGLYFIISPMEYRGIKPNYILSIFLLIWINDTMAYLVGSQFGKNKLAPNISPKKTWEGFIGGALFSMIIGAYALPQLIEISFSEALILTLLVVIAGTFGDLFESLLKRKAGIKDSGNLIPGHGGVLDRLDSILFAAPVAYIYLFISSILK